MDEGADRKWRQGRQEVVGAPGHQEKTLLLRGAATATFIYNSQNTGVVLHWCVTARPRPQPLTPPSQSLVSWSLSLLRHMTPPSGQKLNLFFLPRHCRRQLPVSIYFAVSWQTGEFPLYQQGNSGSSVTMASLSPTPSRPVGVSQGLCGSCAFARCTAAEWEAGLRMVGKN